MRISLIDYLRLLAALLVIISHSYTLLGSKSTDWLHTVTGTIEFATVAVNFFFFLSGYLMYGALARSPDFITFIQNRLARILPGLIVCVLITIVFGYFITSSSYEDYWISQETLRYMGNAAFLFYPSLPGVFISNPFPGVTNGSLWTLSYEILCYSILALTAGMSVRNRAALLVLFSALATLYLMLIVSGTPTMAGNVMRLLSIFCFGYIFAIGGKERVVVFIIFILFFCCGLAMDSLIRPGFWGHLWSIVVCAVALYLAIVSSRKIKSLPFDFSFGIYIYAFPIQQYLVCVFPNMEPLLFSAVSTLCVLPIAAISWYLVEKPGLKIVKQWKPFYTENSKQLG